jgi:hypothetical protein
VSAGRLVARFAEIAPVPLGLPVGDVESRLGPATRIRTTSDGSRPLGFEYADRGVWLAAEDGAVSSISFLTGTVDEGGARFTGVLPGELRVSDPPERVLELYGPPDRIQEIPLPRPPRARMILSFWDLDDHASLMVAVRSDRPAHLERLVLTRRP